MKKPAGCWLEGKQQSQSRPQEPVTALKA